MADLGTLLTIADKVFQLLQSSVLVELKDWKTDVEKLKKSVSFIKNMLRDADEKPQLSHGEQGWVDELKEVLYEADDLFDEVVTLAKQHKELNMDAKFSEKVSRKVSRFFSSKNQILVSYNTCKEVKNIQQKLSDIARDRGRYEFKVDSRATRIRREDTCSFLNEADENMIGRDDDMNAIVDMLLHSNVEQNVRFVVIVGIGGLGKTALARLVFNHDSVKSKFEKRLWACVSDQDGKELDLQAILGNIIESSVNKKPDDVSTMQSLQAKLRKELENKSYLLILDDVWTEDPNEWNKLRRYLTIGERGSSVLVTTRSEKTAEVILGNVFHYNKHMLTGLSDDDSWRLFELTAFERESSHANDPKLPKIGKLIVGKCFNVPLAIKVLGTLLYGQTERWELFVKKRLSEIDTSKISTMSILKFSYNNLEPSMKNCFRYCALFPKDFEMDKQKMISLWMAQGYIDDSEDYFSILLKRCFFQDVKKDECGDVISFKMHDLMHDLAQEVAGEEIIIVNYPTNNLGKTSRHLFVAGGDWTNCSFTKRNFRSCYMYIVVHSNLLKPLVTNWRCLRSLRLCVPDCENLSESIGKLLHLRYLDLSKNWKLKRLPSSIKKLYNLQSLILNGCSGLMEWPEGFFKLVNLRHLDIGWCSGLNFMPLGMDKLTRLRVLSEFKVANFRSSGKQSGELKDLKSLLNLQGRLNIKIGENFVSEKGEDSYLENTKNLKLLKIFFPLKIFEPVNEGIGAENEVVLAKLQPHHNLTQICLSSYYGCEIPRWGRVEDDWANILPNLVKVELKDCQRLQNLPLLNNLKHLKSLFLTQLNNLEYIENSEIRCSCSRSNALPFFPSLEYLRLFNLAKLKGWRRGLGEGDCNSRWPHLRQPFPLLSTLIIDSCPKLTTLPLCPNLELLEVVKSNKSLRIMTSEDRERNSNIKLWVRKIDTVGYLTTLPAGCLTKIKICADSEVKGLSEIEEVLKRCSSLRNLEISQCGSLTSISAGLEHLAALESLSLVDICKLDDGDDNDMPWRSLRHNLYSLELRSLNNMEMLPTGMKHLTALRNLSIEYCSNLKGLPEWIECLSSLHSLTITSCEAIKSLPRAIQNLTSLQKLEIHSCSDLIGVCEEPDGVDWPKVQHIPHISIYDPLKYE